MLAIPLKVIDGAAIMNCFSYQKPPAPVGAAATPHPHSAAAPPHPQSTANWSTFSNRNPYMLDSSSSQLNPGAPANPSTQFKKKSLVFVPR